jgi:hypothetical protein
MIVVRVFVKACLRLVFCLTLLALLGVEAQATPEYPLVLDATFGTSCPNPNSRCVICHTSARGGQATAVRPFAQTLRGYGLSRGRDPGLLQQALQRLPDATDSDDDGAPDKEELMMCGNPSGEDLGAGPEYGCDGAHLAARLPRSNDAPLALVSLLVAGAIVRRRRASVAPLAHERLGRRAARSTHRTSASAPAIDRRAHCDPADPRRI